MAHRPRRSLFGERDAGSRPLLFLIALLAACAGPDTPGRADAQAGEDHGGSDPWERARRQGAEFRAVGQEPGWVFEAYPPDSLRLLADYGELEVVAPWTEPARDTAGVRTWTASADGHLLVVIVQNIHCTDVMSGDSFPQAVTLRLDDREMYGCGRSLRD